MTLSHARVPLSRPRSSLIALLGVALLAGCSSTPAATASGGAPTAASATVVSATPSPSAAVTAAPSAGSNATAAPTSLDPCQLVTQAEASALAGVTFGAGKEETTQGGGKLCSYSGSVLSVVMVEIAQAPDASTAQADWSQEQAKAQAAIQKALPPGISLNLKINDTTGVSGADRAAVATMSTTIAGQSIAVIGIYVLKGATFFTFSDLAINHQAASQSAMEAQATTSLGRVP